MTLLQKSHLSPDHFSYSLGIFRVCWPMMMMVSIAQVSFLLVLPALPAMADDLDVLDGKMRWLVNICLLGMGLGQLFFGPYSDTVGRRPALLLGLFLACIGSLLCVSVDNYSMLLLGRGVTGLGISALSVIARSSIRDVCHGSTLVRALGFLSMAATFGPAVAPMIGGMIVRYFGWSGSLWGVGMIIGAGFIVLLLRFQETKPQNDSRFSMAAVFTRYGQLLKDTYFLTRLSVQVLIYLVVALQTSLAPFLLQRHLHVSAAAFGCYMLIPAVGVLCGGMLVVRSEKRNRLSFIAMLCLIFSGLVLFCLPISIPELMVAFFFQQISYAVILTLVTSSLLQSYQANAGAVVALAGALQFSVGGSLSGFLTQHVVLTHYDLGVAFLILSILLSGLFISWRFVKCAADTVAPFHEGKLSERERSLHEKDV